MAPFRRHAKEGQHAIILVWVRIAKTAAKRPAMRRTVRMPGLGVLLLAAGGLINCLPIASHAQEQVAPRPYWPGAGSPKPGSLEQAAPVGVEPSHSGNQEKAAALKAHRFWDRENNWLFAGVAASRSLDYSSTLNMRRRGRQEIFLTNDAVDNHAAFAAIEASATGVSIAAAYLFHRYGHHKLERWTSILHLELATTGAVRNYCLKTAHFAATPGSP
jgi:hypothetical protein